MAQPYLVSNQFMLPMELSGIYPGRWKIMGKELYVSVQQTESIQIPGNAPRSCNAAYRIHDDVQFHSFITDWMSNTLILYRGFPGCHFCWPRLLHGELRSAGIVDNPEFTMGGSATRWLPTADVNIAQLVTTQCLDIYTRRLAMICSVPIGLTVSIHAGSASNISLCWLNSGEIVVRGPLLSGQYNMSSITWLRKLRLFYTRWPIQFSNVFLPAQRRYEPNSDFDIRNWWSRNYVWMEEARKYIQEIND